jgi:hypothetical protein
MNRPNKSEGRKMKKLIDRISGVFKKPHGKEVDLEHEFAELDKLTESLFGTSRDQVEYYRALFDSNR